MMFRLMMGFVFTLGLSEQALACDWSPTNIDLDKFTSDKVIFWGQIKRSEDRHFSSKEKAYDLIEVIKPVHGKVGNRVKVWTSVGDSCGAYFYPDDVSLYITSPHKSGDLYSDQFHSDYASPAAILFFLKEGIDLYNLEPSSDDEKYADLIDKIYDQSRAEALKIADENPAEKRKVWWKFWDR